MNLPVILRGRARREFDEAVDWYEGRQAGLGDKFTAAVQGVLDDISANPRRHPRALGEVRQGLVRGFPYCVYFREERGRIIVIAIFHASRDPSDWQSRA
jgi:plasmid stabilization system protein ParE